MDQKFRMALKLARKGVDDETIEEVLGMRGPASPPPVSATQAQPKGDSGYRPREENYDALIDAIASTIVREGAIEGTIREVCERHRAAWLSCLPNPSLKPTVRGFAGVVATARKQRGGILRGILKVTRGAPRSGDPKDGYVYRFEAA